MQKFLTDTLTIGKNDLIRQLRNPLWVFFGLFQPIVYLLLFSPFLENIAKTPGFPAENAIQFFVPGLLIMNVLFGAAFAGFGLIDQLRSGFIERIRVTPVNRLAIVMGFVLRSPIVLLIQSSILLITGLFFGLEISAKGVVILALLLSLIGMGIASLSFAIALLARDEGTLAAITNVFALPAMLLSGVMLPIDFAPKILKNLSIIDPFRHAVDASRALINGDLDNQVIGFAFVVFEVIAFLTISWFIRVMREATA
jgi:ABC-2 type transport system permease protein